MLNIALPTDFSDNSKHAIRYACNLFKGEKCNFYLVNSYDTPHAGAGMLVSIVDVLKEEAAKDMSEFYRSIEKEGLTKDFSFHKHIDYGSLNDVLIKLHKRHNMDLIVMGTKGASGIAEVLIGSNTSDVMKSAENPVLVVPQHAVIDKVNRIAFASDNKEIKNKSTLDALNFIAKKSGAEIVVVNVKTSPVDVDFLNETKSSLSKIIEGTSHSFQSIESESIEEGLNDYINLENVDLLAMVSRKIGFFQSLFHQSATKNMAMHSTTPLLVMHE